MFKSIQISSLFLLSTLVIQQSSGVKDWDETVCMFTHCLPQLMACEINSECMKLLQCLALCDDTDAGCAFGCNVGGTAFNNPLFRDFLECAIEFECEAPYPDSGVCLAEDSQAIQTMDWDVIKGDWWTVYGQNCGQEGWEGSYDWVPCSHARIFEIRDDEWVNKVTFCNGQDSTCEDGGLVTVTPNVFWTAPGVLRNDYPSTEAPLTPQIQDWKILWAKEEWAFVVWCGYNPMVKYNGAFILSRNPSDGTLPAHLDSEIRSVVAEYGLDVDAMCLTDSTQCSPDE